MAVPYYCCYTIYFAGSCEHTYGDGVEEKKNLPEDCRPILRIADAYVNVDWSVRAELERYYNRLDLMLYGRYIGADELLAVVYEVISGLSVSETKGFLTERAELYAQALFCAGS